MNRGLAPYPSSAHGHTQACGRRVIVRALTPGRRVLPTGLLNLCDVISSAQLKRPPHEPRTPPSRFTVAIMGCTPYQHISP